MNHIFDIRFIIVYTSFISILLNGCCYYQYMEQEKAREQFLANELRFEQSESVRLSRIQQRLEGEIKRLNQEIEIINNEINERNDEINMLCHKSKKLQRDIAQIKKLNIEVNELEIKIKERQDMIEGNKLEIINLGFGFNF